MIRLWNGAMWFRYQWSDHQYQTTSEWERQYFRSESRYVSGVMSTGRCRSPFRHRVPGMRGQQYEGVVLLAVRLLLAVSFTSLPMIASEVVGQRYESPFVSRPSDSSYVVNGKPVGNITEHDYLVFSRCSPADVASVLMQEAVKPNTVVLKQLTQPLSSDTADVIAGKESIRGVVVEGYNDGDAADLVKRLLSNERLTAITISDSGRYTEGVIPKAIAARKQPIRLGLIGVRGLPENELLEIVSSPVVTHLKLGGVDLSRSTVELISSKKRVLSELDVLDCPTIGESELVPLLRALSPERLVLPRKCKVTDGIISALVDVSGLSSLRLDTAELDCDWSKLAEGFLAGISELSITSTTLGERDWTGLTRGVKNVSVLDLDGSPASSDVAWEFITSRLGLRALSIRLWSVDIGRIERLSKLKHFSVLDMWQVTLPNGWIKELEALKGLRWLGLASTPVNVSQVEAVLSGTNIRVIDVRWTGISQDDAGTLRSKFSEVHIYHHIAN